MSDNKKATWKENLTQARQKLRDTLSQLSPEQWQQEIISEDTTWSVADVISHVVEAEMGMSIHIHKIRKGRPTLPDDFDLVQWNASLTKRRETPAPEQLMEEMVQVRAKTMEVLESLNDDEWALTGKHPAQGVISIEQYYETIIGHDKWHLKDIKKGLGLS